MKVQAPQLPPSLVKDLNLVTLLQSDEKVDSASIANFDASIIKVNAPSIHDSRLEKVTFVKSRMHGSDFLNLKLTKCDLIAADLSRASWHRIAINQSRASGAQLQNSTLRDITFNDCKLDLVNFRMSKIKNVIFKDCNLGEADFYEAKLSNVSFENCKLDKTSFSSVSLKNVDFRTSNLNEIEGLDSLSGAIIDSTQLISLAPRLASVIGIEVKD